MYKITREEVNVGGTSCVTYGVQNGEMCISDISVDKKAVESLVDRLNTYKLDPIHLFDAVEDFLER